MSTTYPIPINPLFINIGGRSFDRLHVVSYAGKNKFNQSIWNCKCDCGKYCVVKTTSLMSGVTKSCGCKQRDAAAARNHKHGKSGTPEHRTWKAMLTRCYNQKGKHYNLYGGRGIVVCDQWKASFATFLADMGPRPSAKHSIDRIDNDGNYEPTNCRWATPAQQRRNTSKIQLVEYAGETLCVKDWAIKLGRSPWALQDRFRKGLRPETGLFAPPRPGRRNDVTRL